MRYLKLQKNVECQNVWDSRSSKVYMSQWMQEGHLRSKTLDSIVQTRDVIAKIEIRNFRKQKIYYGTSR